jgi:hypothetical protein
MAPTRSKER